MLGSLPVVRKNSIRASRSHLLQPVFVVQSTEYCLASENVPCRKAMTMAAHRWRRTDWAGNARTKTCVNSSVIIMGDPVPQSCFRCRSPNGIRKSRHSRRIVPTSRSQTAFAFGARTGVFSIRTPIAVTALSNSFEKMLSRSWIRKRYGCSSVSASRNCCSVHSGLGCVVTL